MTNPVLPRDRLTPRIAALEAELRKLKSRLEAVEAIVNPPPGVETTLDYLLRLARDPTTPQTVRRGAISAVKPFLPRELVEELFAAVDPPVH
jgi:hypothetical protein